MLRLLLRKRSSKLWTLLKISIRSSCENRCEKIWFEYNASIYVLAFFIWREERIFLSWYSECNSIGRGWKLSSAQLGMISSDSTIESRTIHQSSCLWMWHDWNCSLKNWKTNSRQRKSLEICRLKFKSLLMWSVYKISSHKRRGNWETTQEQGLRTFLFLGKTLKRWIKQ